MSNNFFAALDDSDDEVDEEKRDVPQSKVLDISSAAQREGGGGRGGRGRGGRGPSRDHDREYRPRRNPNNNDRHTRYGRGGRAPPREGKRHYDRRSGTGRGREIKKDGGGARNWGSDKNDARRARGTIDDDDEDGAEPAVEHSTEPGYANEEGVEEDHDGETLETAENGDAEEGNQGEDNPEEQPQQDEEEEEEEEEEDKTMTFDEYLNTKELPDSEAFKPLETKTLQNNEFEGKIAKSADKDEDFLTTKGGKALRKKGPKKEKHSLDVGFRVGDFAGGRGRGRGRGYDRDNGDRRDSYGDDRRMGGRGGRGGGRFGDRRGGGRGGRGSRGYRGGDRRDNAELDVADTSAFPSLG